jgi:hypothetical protein
MSQLKQSMTTFSNEEYDRCLPIALDFVDQHGSIRNRQIREVTEISYDQAISFFNRAIEDKHLVRKGKSSGTYYVIGISK